MIAAGPDADPSPPRASGRYPRKMEPIVWENETRSSEPGSVATFSGWNDAASAASTALGAVAESLEDQASRPDRPGGVLRLPGRPAADRAHGRQASGVAGPRTSSLPAAAPKPSATCCSMSGTEPSDPLAHLLQLRPRHRRALRRRVVITSAPFSQTYPTPGRCRSRAWPQTTSWSSDSASMRRLRGPDRDRRRHPRDRRTPGFTPMWAAVPHYAAAVPNSKAPWRCCAGSKA